MNIAPYKFFGIRGFALMYLSDTVKEFTHHKLAGKAVDDWELGSPCTAHFAAITTIVNYVCAIGKNEVPSETGRRRLYEMGMQRIAEHERALLYALLEGVDNVPGLRHIKGITVKMDEPDLSQRDLIIGIELDSMDCTMAAKYFEEQGVITFERRVDSMYSRRMIQCFDSPGMIRISPLHIHSLEDIKQFLRITQQLADKK